MKANVKGNLDYHDCKIGHNMLKFRSSAMSSTHGTNQMLNFHIFLGLRNMLRGVSSKTM